MFLNLLKNNNLDFGYLFFYDFTFVYITNNKIKIPKIAIRNILEKIM